MSRGLTIVCLAFAGLCGFIAAYPGPVAALVGTPKVTICHAAGRAGTTHYVTLSHHAVYGLGGHFYENGTPRAGHEQDYLGPCHADEQTHTTTTATTATHPPTTTHPPGTTSPPPGTTTEATTAPETTATQPPTTTSPDPDTTTTPPKAAKPPKPRPAKPRGVPPSAPPVCRPGQVETKRCGVQGDG